MLHPAGEACKNASVGVLNKDTGHNSSIAMRQRPVNQGVESPTPRASRLLDQVRGAIRRLRYSGRVARRGPSRVCTGAALTRLRENASVRRPV